MSFQGWISLPRSGRGRTHVPGLLQGFEGLARLCRLLEPNLLAALEYCQPHTENRAGIYLSLPSTMPEIEGDASNEISKFAGELNTDCVASTNAVSCASMILGRIHSFTSRSNRPGLRYVTTSGHTGFSEAIISAVNDIRNGDVSQAIVGGCDSLVEERVLKQLGDAGRLKGPDLAVGLEPGEASAFVVIRRNDSRSDSSVLAYVEGFSQSREPAPFGAGEPPTGLGHFESINQLAISMNRPEDFLGWIIHDRNGEVYRAKDWGMTYTRLGEFYASMRKSFEWSPASTFGDTGAASGGVALCMAVRAFNRGYNPYSRAIISSASDCGGRSALQIGSNSVEDSNG